MLKCLLFICLLCSLVVVSSANTPPSGKIILRGVVLDAVSNESLTGALVKVPGTSIYTFTDAQGNFTLECTVANTPQELEISLVSFSLVKVKIDNPLVALHIELQEK